jgi:hypothetical protein
MNPAKEESTMSEKQTPFYFSRKFALGCLAAAAIYFLVMEHWRHLLEVLPYLVFLLCPLMHLMMHGGYD